MTKHFAERKPFSRNFMPKLLSSSSAFFVFIDELLLFKNKMLLVRWFDILFLLGRDRSMCECPNILINMCAILNRIRCVCWAFYICCVLCDSALSLSALKELFVLQIRSVSRTRVIENEPRMASHRKAGTKIRRTKTHSHTQSNNNQKWKKTKFSVCTFAELHFLNFYL